MSLEVFNNIIPYKNKIKELSKEEKCRVWCNLNCWKWDELLGEKPEDWDNIPSYIDNIHSKNDYISPIMHQIDKTVKHKDISYYWNCVYHNDMTKSEFKTWHMKNHSKNYILAILNSFGIYTYTQKKMLKFLRQIADGNKEEELERLYGGKR